MISVGSYLASAVALVAVGLSVAFTAYRLRRKLLPRWSGAPARLIEAVVAMALLIWLGELLGTLGLFYEWIYVGASLAIALLTRALLPAGPVAAGDPPPPPVAKASSGAVPPTESPAAGASKAKADSAPAGPADAPAAEEKADQGQEGEK